MFGFNCLLLTLFISSQFSVLYGSFPSMYCAWTGYNNWDSTQVVSLNNEFLSGQSSYHSNSKEDRRYKWEYCRISGQSSGLQTGSDIQLVDTWYDYEWRRGCGGNTALNYLYSWHSNNKEDRQFRFKCSQINYAYTLDQCYWTSNYVNDWDGSLNFECNNNGLIRTAESVHSNSKEDRRWKFGMFMTLCQSNHFLFFIFCIFCVFWIFVFFLFKE